MELGRKRGGISYRGEVDRWREDHFLREEEIHNSLVRDLVVQTSKEISGRENGGA